MWPVRSERHDYYSQSLLDCQDASSTVPSTTRLIVVKKAGVFNHNDVVF